MSSGSKPTLVVFLGGLGDSSVERLVAGARWAATRDSIDAALASGSYDGVVLVTDALPPSDHTDSVVVDVDEGDFHFGRRLAGVARKYKLNSIVYMGGGSTPLFGGDEFTRIAEVVGGGGTITNNRYSSDLVGFVVTDDTLQLIECVDRDNKLAPQFAENSGLDVMELPRTPETLFDIDAPPDVVVLKVAALGGPHLRQYAGSADVNSAAYERLLPLFLSRENQVIVAGRVGSHTWRYLESETACRVRLFAEERGMEADGRAETGTARSLLGYYLDAVGSERFFETLSELGDAAIIDSRVLVAHAGSLPSREDRFLSDLGQWQMVQDPFLREFTKGSANAAIPVVLGGHSVMSGALMLLNETAWRFKDEGRPAAAI